MRDWAGRFTTIRIPGAESAWAAGINNRRQVVGIYSENTALVKDLGAKTHGFLWDRGKVTRIDFPGAGHDWSIRHQRSGAGGGRLPRPERQRDGQRFPLEQTPVHPNRAPRGRDNCGLRHQQPRPDRRHLRRRRRCGGGDASRLPDDQASIHDLRRAGRPVHCARRDQRPRPDLRLHADADRG